MTSILFKAADKILDVLNFNGCVNPHFLDDGIGKIGTTGFFLGIICGLHFGIAIMSSILMYYVGSLSFIITLRMWSIYMGLLCFFHFLEFFITAVRQSKNLSFDSFVITHGRSYTLAAGIFSCY
jgi:protein-S-isoprenylcysteine O-methyltransferase